LKIAVNAISLRKGGTVIAVGKLLSRLVELWPEHEYHVLADVELPPVLKVEHPSVRYHHFSWIGGGHFRAAIWYALILPFWLRSKAVDVLFSSSCYLPIFTTSRTVLLVQDAKYFYDATDLLKQCSIGERAVFHLKRLWTYYSVRKADSVIVQTKTLGDCVTSHIPAIHKRLVTIPHGPGVFDDTWKGYHIRHLSSDSFEIAYVALYRNYKNFHMLLQALALLQERQVPVRLHLTLDTLEDVGARSVLTYARKIGVERLIVNHGEIEPDRIAELYGAMHMFVFPSICESFGFPQVEAMAFGLPLLVSDTPVNREVCGHAAMFFPPDDPAQLAASIEHFYRNPSELSALADLSARRGRDFDWTRAAAETLQCLIAIQNGPGRAGERQRERRSPAASSPSR
jgi:glycosyltransferase involved in cell wall biosynthesis